MGKLRSVEDEIRGAIEAGQFDNLPGKGKPLRIRSDPFEVPEWSMANHVLNNAGFTLPWIESRREIETGIEAARAALSRAWLWREKARAEKQPEALIDSEWNRAEGNFRDQVAEINRKIFDYNLMAPSSQFQTGTLNADREIEALMGGSTR